MQLATLYQFRRRSNLNFSTLGAAFSLMFMALCYLKSFCMCLQKSYFALHDAFIYYVIFNCR